MSLLLSRRALLAAGAGCSVAWSLPSWASDEVARHLGQLERESGITLGLWALDTGNGNRVAYRADERFAVCSTFKVVLAAAILARSAQDPGLLGRLVTYSNDQLVVYSPVTQQHVATGMTVSALCAAALQYSDNTAANLLLDRVGGPAGLTRFARQLGDEVFRLDRHEPELNSALPGDLRDTSTPLAMGMTLQRLLMGDALPGPARSQLQAWLKGNTTGASRIRAGVPEGWVVGDKTGSGDFGVANDVAMVWPTGRAPWLICVYTRGKAKDAPWQSAPIAAATAWVVKALG